MSAAGAPSYALAREPAGVRVFLSRTDKAGTVSLYCGLSVAAGEPLLRALTLVSSECAERLWADLVSALGPPVAQPAAAG